MSEASSAVRGAGAIGRGLAAAREARPIVQGDAIHVVGAAGAGASAAALLAASAGAVVTGCDAGGTSAYTAALDARGIEVADHHDPAHVLSARPRPARLAVTKALTSVQPDHPELMAARDLGIVIEPWQQVVADTAATQGGRLVAVAGTHGKSTSAGWLVHVLTESGRDPAAFVGALLPASSSAGLPATARWGSGDTFVVEADEYAGNFDPYRPDVAIVLNAEWDHPDVFADGSAVVMAFEAWLRAPGEGTRLAVVGVDGAGGQALAAGLSDWGDRLVTVGATDGTVRYDFDGRRVTIDGLPGTAGERVVSDLRLPGRHNAANAAAVAAAAALLDVPPSVIGATAGSYPGVARRLEVKGEPRGVLVIDDYGHHPSAIRSTLSAVRERYPGRPVWLAHEPLTFHRAAAMLDELAASLALADHVVIADIWAGRDPDTTITSAAALAAAVAGVSGEDVAAPGSVEDTADALAERVRPGDIVLVMGGGRSYVIADRLVGLLHERAGV